MGLGVVSYDSGSQVSAGSFGCYVSLVNVGR